jgi:glycosyltransferase involved in cell wall biosynthesis
MIEAHRSRLRALSVIDSLGQGGAERSLIDLARGLRGYDIEITLAVLQVRGHGFQRLIEETPGLSVEVLGANRLQAMRRLRALLRDGGFDLLHTSLFDASVLGRIAAGRTGVPVLTSLVNVSYDPVRRLDPRVSGFKLTVARWVDGWTARHLTTRFHALTSAVAAQAVVDLGVEASSIAVIPRGRDQAEFHPAASHASRASIRSELGLDPAATVFLNVGRHEFQKGHRFLLEAMASVVREVPDAVLLILGREGNETSDILDLISKHDLKAQVRVMGDRRDVNRILRAADVFVFPSLYEGFGGALIEAMATGLPVVASDLPPVREVLGDIGVLVPPADPAALAGAMKTLASDQARVKELGRAGLARFQTHYRLDQVVSDMAGLFRETAGSVASTSGMRR